MSERPQINPEQDPFQTKLKRVFSHIRVKTEMEYEQSEDTWISCFYKKLTVFQGELYGLEQNGFLTKEQYDVIQQKFIELEHSSKTVGEQYHSQHDVPPIEVVNKLFDELYNLFEEAMNFIENGKKNVFLSEIDLKNSEQFSYEDLLGFVQQLAVQAEQTATKEMFISSQVDWSQALGTILNHLSGALQFMEFEDKISPEDYLTYSRALQNLDFLRVKIRNGVVLSDEEVLQIKPEVSIVQYKKIAAGIVGASTRYQREKRDLLAE